VRTSLRTGLLPPTDEACAARRGRRPRRTPEDRVSSIGRPRVCILKADGTNCEVETGHAFALAGADPEIVPMNLLRWRERRLSDYDVLVAPGGFSYGDDVASGKVMAVELMSFLADEMRAFAAAGKPILGVCNGFQVLVRTGLLPFGELGTMRATLTTNASGRFECRWVEMRRESEPAILSGVPDRLALPSAHAEGRFYADPDTLARIEAAGLVALRYVDRDGGPTATYPANPNGSLNAIAGLTDPTGRILGLMPHPERYVQPYQRPGWQQRPGDGVPDGLAVFRRIVAIA
jgi:phosphoribosylformylglycinamidine synthase subunit PurQ / glutaminase